MIVGQTLDMACVFHDSTATLNSDVFHLLNGLKASVDKRLIDNPPQALCRLEFGAVCGQEYAV